jgi:gliding motility-associated lipoprotein GldB
MHKCLNVLPFILLLGLVVCCSTGGSEAPNVDHIEVSLDIKRWDQEVFELASKSQIADFLKANPLYSNQFLHIDQYPHDSVAVNYLNAFINNPASQVLKQEINTVFGPLDQLKDNLAHAFKYLKYYYPQWEIPNVYTAVTGFAGNDLYVSDSAIVIGLDYYLGEGATYRPLEFPQYILKKYRQEYIVPSIVLLLSSGLNNTEVEDKSMLAEMIYYGKAYYFTSQIIPNIEDSLLIGYSGEEIRDVNQNQDVIWAHFVDKQLLYETSHFTKKKYMDERPKTLEIGNKCPGRIGEWLGWEIVKKYMEEQSLDLPELMEVSDARQVFMQSNYKPQVP